MKLYIHDPITNGGTEPVLDSLIETVEGADYTLQHREIPSWMRISFFYDDDTSVMKKVYGVHDMNSHLLTFSPYDTPTREVRDDGLHLIRYIPQYEAGQRVVFLASMVMDGQNTIRTLYDKHKTEILRGCEIYWELGDHADLDDALRRAVVDEGLIKVAHCFVMGEMYPANS